MNSNKTTQTNDGGPAFPTENERQIGPDAFRFEGMTLRDYFAGQAINLFSLNDDEVQDIINGDPPPNHTIVAKFCYQLADKMLAEREHE